MQKRQVFEVEVEAQAHSEYENVAREKTVPHRVWLLLCAASASLSQMQWGTGGSRACNVPLLKVHDRENKSE